MNATKTAVVSGAGGGIGAATVDALAEQGYTVTAVDVAFGDTSERPAVTRVELDVRDSGCCVSLLESISPPTLLVNAAAVRPAAPFLEQDLDGWRIAFEVNVLGAFTLLQAAARHMDPGGSVVNVASGAAYGKRDLVAYGATKAAMISMSKTAALELDERGLRVNVVIPGTTQTPMLVNAGITSTSPNSRNIAGRTLTADDVADGIVRTAHDPMLSGAVIPVGLLPPQW